MGKLGIAKAVVVSAGGYGRNPRHLADVLARYPDRNRGVALVPDDIASTEIARLDKLGVRGIRFMSASWRADVEVHVRSLAGLADDVEAHGSAFGVRWDGIVRGLRRRSG